MYTIHSIMSLNVLEKNAFEFKTQSELSDWVLENKIQCFVSKFYFHDINGHIPTVCSNIPLQEEYFTVICIDF